MADIQKINAKKSLGQHFLTSAVVPSWMCDAADITSNDTVLEIGPGTGVLTNELLKRGATVVALEADTRAIEALQTTFKDEITSGTLILHHTDVRTLDLAKLPHISNHSFKVVANIPYYLSGLLFRMFLESAIQPTDLVYLVQKEVAKRATSNISKGEKESLLSLSVQAYGTPKYVKTVTRGHFTPPPKVDSGIIAIRNISKNNFKDIDESLFFNILHLGFGQKRKQLLGNLTKQYDRELLTHTFSTVDIPVSIRAEDVPLEKWLILVESLVAHS
ncbi:MAG: 16S rRNA (adenine1518-N6/adenine1519-N6)-dimethyltransferase [Acidimicrobiales bacterium]|jgi:16S rRNA (adenine1518-N6/adenine1519-N6)-dimethyltransferase